jgi:hypothetical protein
MDSYMSSSVDLKDDTHASNCCRLVMKTEPKFTRCRRSDYLEYLSSSTARRIETSFVPFEHLAA